LFDYADTASARVLSRTSHPYRSLSTSRPTRRRRPYPLRLPARCTIDALARTPSASGC